jgi:hypothetical protein
MSVPASSPLANPHARPYTRDAANYTFDGKYPALSDILHYGGVPGVRYALVSAARIGHYQAHLGYDLVRRLPAITIHIADGLHAGDHSAMLMCNGAPIACAAPDGSVRIFEIDPHLDAATGLGPAPRATVKPTTTKG